MNTQAPGSTVHWNRFTSEVLDGNPLGDPVTRALPVILPPGYDPASGRHYPVIYGLTGFTGRGSMMLNAGAWQPNLQERLDLLYARGMPHAIVVLPDCFTRLGGSQYLNSAATGRYEDYVTKEIMPYVDAQYPTIATADGRGVFGKSSGGYGALLLGMRHAELFGAVACHSGDMAFDLCYRPDFPKAANAIDQAGGLETWLQNFEAKVKQLRADIEVMNIVAMAACYSPDPVEPLGIALPFDLETCELREDIWSRWLAWDPVRIVEQHAGALRSLQLLFVDCGTRDEFNLHFGARQLVQRLRIYDIVHEYEEFDDGHMDISYRYDVSLPRLAQALHSSAAAE